MPLPIETENDTTSIVLVGSFNPAIFQPMWFAAHEMISRVDAEEANVIVIHPEITQFTTRQFRLSVEHTRFSATCESIHRNIVRDLVLTCFGRILVHSPIRMMGLNRELHFSCGTEAQRSKFGFSLAPLEPWGQWGKEIESEVKKENAHGGMMRLQMREVPRPDGRDGYIQADIQPSTQIRGGSGVFLQINNHFEFTRDLEHPTLKPMETLDGGWEEGAQKTERIISEVMQQALKAD